MKIFVINAGSSSLKYQLIDSETEQVLAIGLCERIGIDGHLTHRPFVDGKPHYDSDFALPDHGEAISAVLNILMSEAYGVITGADEISAVGHRVVHGGERFSQSQLITDEVLGAIEECIPLAPLHNPANIAGIEACRKLMGATPQVAVFDTAYHQTLPQKAYTYAVPYEYYEKYRVRRYGFHGTSHRYVSQKAAEILGKPITDLKLITCHLGNGSSICAIDGGNSVDTSMGFTPIAGLPMGTRSGDMDSGIMEFLMGAENLNITAMMEILNKKSGMLGISGVSSDFRDIESKISEGNERAKLALETFDYAVAKTIGAYAAVLGGVDAVIFTAGIGENSNTRRAGISGYLGYLGAHLDAEANNVRGTTEISTADSSVKLLVVPTNEELVIARDTMALVKNIS